MSSCIDCLNACWHYENAWAGMVLLRIIVYHEVLFCERPYNNITHTHTTLWDMFVYFPSFIFALQFIFLTMLTYFIALFHCQSTSGFLTLK